MRVVYSEFVKILKEHGHCNPGKKKCLQFCEEKSGKSFNDDEIKIAEQKIKTFAGKFWVKWKQSNRTDSKFEIRNKDWLEKSMEIEISGQYHAGEILSNNLQPGPGRCSKSFAESSIRSQRRKRDHALDVIENDSNLLLSATLKVTKKNKEHDLNKVLSYAIHEPDKKKLCMLIEKAPTQMSDVEALATFMDTDLSRNAYQILRNKSVSHNSSLFPPYSKILQQKKLCIPQGVTVTSLCAEVPMDSLLEHTLQRLAEAYHDEISQKCAGMGQVIYATFFIASGQDSTSHQIRFNQRLDQNPDDSTLFVISINPLCLMAADDGTWLYINPCPQSPRSVRPQKMFFGKEDAKTNCDEYEKSTRALEDLKSKEYFSEIVLSSGQTLRVKLDYRPTLNDGKVISHVHGVAFCRCVACYCPPSFMNTYDKWIEHKEYNLNPDAFLHGIRPLHTTMGVLNHLINLSCRLFMDKSKSQARGENVKTVKEQHVNLQQKFIDEFDMRVGFPKPEGGTTTSGKTARLLFDQSDKLADALKIDHELVNILSLLLIAIRSFHPVNLEEFEKLANRANEIYDAKYYNIPKNSKLHWLLTHGVDTLLYLPLPPGYYSEECAESNNKFLRRDRDNHARHDSREHNLADVFNNALVRSDPKVSKFGMDRRQMKKKKKKITPELRRLLIIDDLSTFDYISDDEDMEM